MTYRLDAELAPLVPTLPDVDMADAPATRARAAELLTRMPAPDISGVDVREVRVPGPDGAPDVTLRIHSPIERRSRLLPLIYDIHGGGFVTGSLDGIHARDLRLCREVGAVVVAVDYRLAPEHPFPAPLDDCYAGLVWTADHAAELGVDPDRIAVHGQSAGGGLAAAVALLARDRGGPAVCFQYLGVPALDDRLSTASMRSFTNTPAWQRSQALLSWTAYLGEGVPGSDGVSAYAAPARAATLAGLPPAYVSAMEFDPLRDEGIAYAAGLLAAGVSTELHVFPGAFHGSVGCPSALSRRELAEETAVLTRALHA